MRAAISMPARSAASASSRVIAGPTAMLAVPSAMRVRMIPPVEMSGFATPMSTTTTFAPACLAS